MDKAQTRLRQTFRYPTDDDDGDAAGRDDLDEQQQEELVSKLRTESSSTDTLYTRIFTALPIIAIVPFFWHLSAVNRLLWSLLGMASLVCTAWVVAMVSPDETARRAAGTVDGKGQGKGKEAWYMPFQWPEKASTKYVHQILVWGNTGVCAVLGIGGYFYLTFRDHSGKEGDDVYGTLLLVPGVMFVVVSGVRQSMADVNRGVGELEGLRYGLKGA